MKIKQTYKPDTAKLLSWNDLKVGDVFYHTFLKSVGMKTSKNSYVSFYDHKYHTRSKLLQGANPTVYYQIYAEFTFEL